MPGNERHTEAWSEIAFTIAAAIVLPVSIVSLPGAAPREEPIYALLGAGVLAGSLLTVRLGPHRRPASFVVVPLLVAWSVFGPAALPLLVFATAAAHLVRRARPSSAAIATGQEAVAFAAAAAVAGAAALGEPWSMAFFAAAFILGRGLLSLVARALRAASAEDPRSEQPDVLLSLTLAPLVALPLAARLSLGDGALLLTLAALLALLTVVREAANLATARGEMEAERDRLARASARQSEMMHLITHELKNPLNVILGYTQLTQRALADQNVGVVAGYVQHVEQAGRSIQRLVDNLLRLSRLEQRAELSPPETVDVGSLAHEIADGMQPLAEQKQQSLVVEVAPDLPCAYVAPLLLREALSNLVSNAVKYTPEGGRVRVWATNEVGSDVVVLGVTDSGIGLSEADQARLFTKFFRSDDPRAQEQRGSGLGLALTQAIVQRMGGTILVESALDQGTTFRIVLPVRPA